MDLEFELSRTHLPIASLYRHARQLGDRPAFVDADRTINYRQLLRRVQVAAARLAELGVGRGDRVALIAGNSVDYPVPVYAANYLGALIVPINFRLAAEEIAYILENCTPTVVVADEEYADVTRKANSGLDTTQLDLAELAADGQPHAIPDPVLCAPDDDRAIMYTSGTTGRPKGAVLSYSNFFTMTARMTASWGYEAGKDAVLIASPMFHIAAFNVMTSDIANAAASIITSSTGFDPGHLLDLMERHKVTQTFMVPAQWQLIVNEQRRQPRDLSLKFYSWGASPATEALLTSLRETFANANSQAAFGQTETTAIGAALSHEDSLRKLGTVGLPDRNFSIRIVDADMNDVPQGEVGEIVYRGPGIMSRFWNNEAATREAFAGGWFHSGDLVRQDEEGFIYVVDRAKDMIISGGENIYSAELENVIAWHPKVAEVAVVGRPDEKWGEIPVAVIIPRDPQDPPTLEEIRAACEDKLARYKMPKAIVLRDVFPRSGTGKVQKIVLRQEI